MALCIDGTSGGPRVRTALVSGHMQGIIFTPPQYQLAASPSEAIIDVSMGIVRRQIHGSSS
jgi:hypothetical protein